MQEFVTRSEVLPALQQFCAEHGTNVAVLLGLKIDGDSIRRDLAVFNMDATEKAKKVSMNMRCGYKIIVFVNFLLPSGRLTCVV